MEEIKSIRKKFDFIIDHFSSVEIDSCVSHLQVQILMYQVVKDNCSSTIQYGRKFKPYYQDVPQWKSSSISSPFMSISNCISTIDHALNTINKESNLTPIIPTVLVVHVKVHDHNIRYKEYLYNISISIKNQLGIEFAVPPSIPYYEEDFFVGFSLANTDTLHKMLNDRINILKKKDEEEIKAKSEAELETELETESLKLESKISEMVQETLSDVLISDLDNNPFIHAKIGTIEDLKSDTKQKRGKVYKFLRSLIPC